MIVHMLPQHVGRQRGDYYCVAHGYVEPQTLWGQPFSVYCRFHCTNLSLTPGSKQVEVYTIDSL